MGAVAYSSGSGSFTIPSEVKKAWVSCVGGGGAAGALAGGGGGWGYGAVNVSSTTINYNAGSGGQGANKTFYGNGGSSSSCLGIVGYGGGGGGNGYTGSGGGFVGPNGANGQTPDISRDYLFITGGAAGGVSGSGFQESPQPVANGDTNTYLGAGGNGNNGFGGANIGGQASGDRNDSIGGNGANYGGGGGATDWDSNTYTAVGGSGGAGLVYVYWIDITAGTTTLRSGQSTTVSWSSPVDSGSQTVSYTNNGTTNITETYTRTDSRGAESTITFTILPAVRITSFTANPNPQTSGIDGVPNYDTQLSWSAIGATSASINQSIGNVSGSGSTTVTNLPQSTAGSNSPASRTYTLTASDGFSTDTATVTVLVYNDNTPNDFSLPNQNNVEPNTATTVSTSISGIDMVTSVNGGPGVQVSTNGSSFSSNTTITNNQTLYARVTSLGFNQDPSGLTNSKEFYVDVGPLRRYFTVTTRAPDVNETLNLPNESDRVPYPDIDTIDEPSEQYIVSNTLSVDDIELGNPSGVEIRTNNGNAQIRKKITGTSTWGSWQNVRSI